MKTTNKNITDVCFDQKEINKIIELCDDDRTLFYEKSKDIYCKNTKSDAVYYLKEGKVKVHINIFNGNSQITRFVTPGEMFGLRSAITGNNHLTTATAIEDSTICVIPRNTFLQIIKEKTEISTCILKYLINMLHDIENRSISFLMKSERERLAENLLVLHNKFHSDTIKILKKDLANYTNIERDSLTSHLRIFKDQDLIAFNSERIKIKNIDALKKLARSDV